MYRTLQLALLLIVGPTLCAQAASGDAERGSELYLGFACYSCHGYNATGRTPLSRETSGILSSERVFLRYLRQRADQNPVNPKNTMPHYAEDSLSDAEALDIFAYLVSLDDDPPELEDIPAMRQIIEDAKGEADNDSDAQ